MQAIAVMLIEFALLFDLYHRAIGTVFEKPVRWVGIVIFIPQDLIMNYWLSVLFLDQPGHATELVTGRIKRYKRQLQGLPQESMNRREKFRIGFAVKLCNHLNKSDKEHC